MYPMSPAASRPAMQPLGAPGTPASPQALPYNYFPAPQIGQASAGVPASPIAPMMQNTQAQIGDALAAARGPQPPPQLAVQPPNQQQPLNQQQSYDPMPGALGMASRQPGVHQQQSSPWGAGPGAPPLPPGGQQMLPQQQQSGQWGAGPQQPVPGGMPSAFREFMAGLGGQGRQRMWGGYNWGGQQGGGEPGRTPYPTGVQRSDFPHAPNFEDGYGSGGVRPGYNWQAGGR